MNRSRALIWRMGDTDCLFVDDAGIGGIEDRLATLLQMQDSHGARLTTVRWEEIDATAETLPPAAPNDTEWLRADIGALESMLATLPAQNLIERKSLECRLTQQREELARTETLPPPDDRAVPARDARGRAEMPTIPGDE